MDPNGQVCYCQNKESCINTFFQWESTKVSRLHMYSPLQSEPPQRQAESAGIFFLLHPSANQKNNIQLFKVYQWMQNHSYQIRGSRISRSLILSQVPLTYALFYLQKPQVLSGNSLGSRWHCPSCAPLLLILFSVALHLSRSSATWKPLKARIMNAFTSAPLPAVPYIADIHLILLKRFASV